MRRIPSLAPTPLGPASGSTHPPTIRRRRPEATTSGLWGPWGRRRRAAGGAREGLGRARALWAAAAAAGTRAMAGSSSLEAVRRKIRSLQEQADSAEERAGGLQRELDLERKLRETVSAHPAHLGGPRRPMEAGEGEMQGIAEEVLEAAVTRRLRSGQPLCFPPLGELVLRGGTPRAGSKALGASEVRVCPVHPERGFLPIRRLPGARLQSCAFVTGHRDVGVSSLRGTRSLLLPLRAVARAAQLLAGRE